MFDLWLLFMLFGILFLKPFSPPQSCVFLVWGNGEHFSHDISKPKQALITRIQKTSHTGEDSAGLSLPLVS